MLIFILKKKTLWNFQSTFFSQIIHARDWDIFKEILLKLANREWLAMCEEFSIIVRKFWFWLSVRNGRASSKLASYAELRIVEYKIVNVYGLF